MNLGVPCLDLEAWKSTKASANTYYADESRCDAHRIPSRVLRFQSPRRLHGSDVSLTCLTACGASPDTFPPELSSIHMSHS